MKLEEVKQLVKSIKGVSVTVNKVGGYTYLVSTYKEDGVSKVIERVKLNLDNDTEIFFNLDRLKKQVDTKRRIKENEFFNSTTAKVSPEFPNYIVSIDGRVFSKVTHNELKGYTERAGYKCMKLMKDGKPVNVKVHQLIANAFLGYIRPTNHAGAFTNESIVCDHIDNNKLNNHVDNLQLITQAQNCTKDKKIGKSGYRGVIYNMKSDRYYVRIRYKTEKFSIANAKEHTPEEMENLSIIYATAVDFINDLNMRDWKEANKDTVFNIQFAA